MRSLLTLIFFIFSLHAETIYIYPGSWGDIFNITDNNRDGAHNCTHALKEYYENKGIKVIQTHTLKNLTDVKAIITFDLPENSKELLKYPKKKRILFLWEPPTTKPANYLKKNHKYYSKIYTWNDDFIDNKRYFKVYHAQPELKMVEPVPFKEKKLCAMIANNRSSKHRHQLYKKRKQSIAYFNKHAPKDFDLFGSGWESENLQVYRGRVPIKKECLKNYKFSICYENIYGLNGYVTEKIFDSFVAGCVPVYLGAKNITDCIPKSCYIDRRDFRSHKLLIKQLKNISEKEYNTYLENIRQFLASQEAQHYSIDYFIQTFETIFSEK